MLTTILEALSRARLDLANEAACQLGIAKTFEAAGLPFEREVWLSRSDRIDFLLERIGIEVKLKGQPMAVFRQCRRYCESGRLDALILVTAKAMRLPPEIAGVETRLLSLGAAWL